MAKIRCSLFFEFGKFGWSETYVQEAANVDALMGSAISLVTARRKILAFNVTTPFFRLSDADVFRDSRVNNVAAGSAKGMQLEKCTEPWNSLLIRMESGTLYRKNIFLRGYPDIDTDPDVGLEDLPAGFKQDVKDYLDFLVKSGWGFLARVRFPVNSRFQNQYGRVIDVDATVTPGSLVVTTDNDHLMGNGDRVIIRNVKGTRKANGVHLIKATGYVSTKFEIIGVTDPRGYLGGGFWRVFQNLVQVPDKARFMRIVKRDTGRPSVSPRGRRLTARP